MRRSIAVVVIGLGAGFALQSRVGTTQLETAPALLQEMKTLESSRNDAIRRKDLDTIQRLYAEDFTGVASNGQRVTRSELLEVFRRQPDGFIGASDELAIRSLGPDAVIVTGRLTITRPNDPQSTPTISRFTHIFQRLDGRWRMVAGQSTPVPDAR
jgi:uncharacterized protein (TIGR02246 family)